MFNCSTQTNEGDIRQSSNNINYRTGEHLQVIRDALDTSR